jgi:hypothetical protein
MLLITIVEIIVSFPNVSIHRFLTKNTRLFAIYRDCKSSIMVRQLLFNFQFSLIKRYVIKINDYNKQFVYISKVITIVLISFISKYYKINNLIINIFIYKNKK